MPIQIDVNGVWKDPNAIQINIGGVWKTVTDGWINVGGVWKVMYTSDITPPTAPTSVSASTAGASTIHITWSGATDNVAIASYVLYRSDTGVSGTYNQITTTDTTFYDDNSVSTGVTYYYKVKTVDTSNLESGLSSVSNGVTLSSLTIGITSNVSGEMYITWTGGTANTRIYRSINDNTSYNLIFTDTSALGYYNDTELLSNKLYFYKASNNNGATYSNEVSGYPNGIPI